MVLVSILLLPYKCRGEKRGFGGEMHFIVEMATHHWFWSQLPPSLISIRTCVLKTGNSTSRYCHWITRQWRCISRPMAAVGDQIQSETVSVTDNCIQSIY
ncbi:uncharacterized protein B0J16DRAFT_337852 [Fusarium flagelliforme]|uniref:uncharacterized protein n=1 Tax=Fusarium flagelliforme TaxID=2675880 RepID=UPI001E8D3C37|nr:uncharacterized protein B0J16DRAFT_337852 [Fusarium flagelliforme]KAH7188712.1 hypothetical protein B0J16DRAFT_337852 [Fusarium flagelliforme]